MRCHPLLHWLCTPAVGTVSPPALHGTEMIVRGYQHCILPKMLKRGAMSGGSRSCGNASTAHGTEDAS